VSLLRVLVFAVPIAIGIWTSNQPEYRRFGVLLVAAGFVWSLTTLSESNDEVLYSIGRITAWLSEVVLAFLVLAFPSGRLTTAVESWIVGLWVTLALTLYVPSALIVERYPEPSPWASCGLDCPPNAFMVLDQQPAFVEGPIFQFRELAALGLFLAVAGVLAWRVRRASPLMLRTLTPVLAVAILRCVSVAPYVAIRRVSEEAPSLEVVGWMIVLCFPAMAVAFFVGLIRRRVFVGSALQQLATRLRGHPHADELRTILADTLSDPSLEVVYWVPGQPSRWVDAGGRTVRLPPSDPSRWATEISHTDGRVAALVHDAALSGQRSFVEAAGSFALAALQNERLAAQVVTSMADLQESRARIQAVADNERQRIERDLHDGAQQRLVALRVRLELAGELMRDNPERGSALLRELGGDVDQALEEVRSLASGIYPPLLADRGLAQALGAVALRAPLPTAVETEGIGRYAADIESAVYFCCLEALQNAAKHARGASRVSISLLDDGALHFAIRDDGSGFRLESVTPGAGLTNMRDRLAAVSGELTISSAPGEGTSVEGSIQQAELRG